MPDLPDAMDGLSDRLRSATGIPWRLDACGVTRSGSAIPVLLHPDASDPDSMSIRVLLIGGLSGRPGDVDVARTAAELLPRKAREAGVDLAVSVIPVANPDALARGGLSLDGNAGHGPGGDTVNRGSLGGQGYGAG